MRKIHTEENPGKCSRKEAIKISVLSAIASLIGSMLFYTVAELLKE